MNGKPSSLGPAVSPISDGEYQAQSDHRTLSDAADIQGNPTRMNGVKKHQTRQEKKLALMRKSMLGKSPMVGGRR